MIGTMDRDPRRAARARRLRRSQRRLPLNPYLQITSMTDMFTLILAFLLTFYDPNVVDAPSLVLPAVPVTSDEKRGPRVEVRSDAIVVDGVVVAQLDGHGGLGSGVERDADGIRAVREALASRAEEDATLLVACDKTAPYGIVGEVLVSARAAGFDDYRFVVESTR